MDDDEEELSEEAIIAEAVHRAKKAFEDYLYEEHNLDPAYWSLRIVVRSVNDDFTEFLGEYIFDDKGGYGQKTE